MKTCSHCGKEKPLTEYYRNPKARDGLQYCCKDCNRDLVRASWERRKDEYKAKRQEQYRRRKKRHKCNYRFGFCIHCRYEKRLAIFKGNPVPSIPGGHVVTERMNNV